MPEKKENVKAEFEREYIIPLRRNWNKVPRYKRANKAIITIKEFLIRHMKIRDGDLGKIKIDKYLNELIWFRGIRKPPAKIKVKVVKDGENIIAQLSELPKELEFKKLKLEKREKAAEAKKKPAEKPTEEKVPEKTEADEKEKEQEKKETEEKKASVIQTGKQLEKSAAKTMKHQTKMQKQPKRQRRMALQK